MIRRLTLVPRIHGIAGPASFQRRLAAGLAGRAIEVSSDVRTPGDAVLVIGGTRSLGGLLAARRRGVRVIQRLDGLNWIHRRRPTGASHFLRAELNNLLLRLIRSRLADQVVYQSQFARTWWERRFGPAPGASTVIRNAVPLDEFTPDGARLEAVAERRLLVLEGALGGGYEIGLEWAVGLADRLAEVEPGGIRLSILGRPGGRISKPARAGTVNLEWIGEVAPAEVPRWLRSADLLFSADLHPACPNSVIESLACGTPVAAFDTGAIPEIVDERSGAVVPFGGDPWRIDPPDLDGLARAALGILGDLPRFRSGARRRAEEGFGLDRMIEEYLAVLGW